MEVRDNYVKTESDSDYSYGMYGNTGATLNDATGNNKNCKVRLAVKFSQLKSTQVKY